MGKFPKLGKALSALGEFSKMNSQNPPQAYPPQAHDPNMAHAHSNVQFGHDPIHNIHQSHHGANFSHPIHNIHQSNHGANFAPAMPRYKVVCDANSNQKSSFMHSMVVIKVFPPHAQTINTLCNSNMFNSIEDLRVFLTQVANIHVACSRNGQVYNQPLEQINNRKDKIMVPSESSERFVSEICRALQITARHDPKKFQKLAKKGYIDSSAALQYATDLKYRSMI